ncbi:MAG: hypothetical protein ABI051_00400 [Vicinamibacterales bacterium]
MDATETPLQPTQQTYQREQPPPIRTTVDALLDTYQSEGLFAALHPDDRNRLLNAVNPARKDVVLLKAERLAINSNRNLSPEGLATERVALTERAKAIANTWAFAKLKQAIDDERTDLEARAVQGFVGDARGGYKAAAAYEPTPRDLAREPVLLARLYDLEAKDRGAVERLYTAAVQSGGDPELVRCVEGAFSAFPLISPATAAAVRKQRIEASPLAGRLRQLEALKQACTHFSVRAHDEIGVPESL